MDNRQWFAVISSLTFGRKLLVEYINAKGEDKAWNGLRLIPANTSCTSCGKAWHVRNTKNRPIDADTIKWRMAHLLQGKCYHCNSDQQCKVIESPVKSRGYFGGKAMESLHFRVGTSKGMIRTVCVDSLRSDPIEK